MQEVERNLQDAMQVCRNVLLDPFLLPGGGAVEMAVSKRLTERSRALLSRPTHGGAGSEFTLRDTLTIILPSESTTYP